MIVFRKSKQPAARLRFTLFALLLSAAPGLRGADYFVSKTGQDAADGRSREKPFGTIQKGLDALQPGDSLTIGPGEYFENVKRDSLGSPEVDTVIRAEIPGTAVLRGDAPAPQFKKVEGYRFVYAAPFDQAPEAVLEHHTWHTMFPKPNVPELEFNPGCFHYDTNSRTLYLSNPDLTSPDQRRYTVAVKGGNGLHLTSPRRVVIEGLSATGFHPGWGILLMDPVSCVVRDCTTFLNVGGIELASSKGVGSAGGSNNVVENCRSFGNSFGGIVRYGADHDVIRNCRTFRNQRENQEHFGIMHYSTMHGPLLIENNIAWGQNFNYSVKAGDQQERLEGNVGLGLIRLSTGKMARNLFDGGNEYARGGAAPADTILFRREENLDHNVEFADPLNLDFRLQPDSRFRGTGPGQADRGPYPYATNIFYVATNGNDQADGLSMRQPWRTLQRGLRDLRPGDTLYLAEGEYAAAPWDKAGDGKNPIRICARGRGTTAITGKLTLKRGAGIAFERLNFAGGVELLAGGGVSFNNCTFFGQAGGLSARGTRGLAVTHCVFAGVPLDLKKTQGAVLSGNLLAGSPAVRLDSLAAVRYSDYNGYQNASPCWQVGRATRAMKELPPQSDRYSQALTPEFAMENGVPRLRNTEPFRGLGPHSTALGLHFDYQIAAEGIDLVGPFLHSAHDTTANLEWWSSHPANYTVAWGETPAMTNASRTLRGPERFNTFSLTGLKPGCTYFFAIRSAEAVVGEGAAKLPVLRPPPPLSFTTAPAPAAPRTWYAAPDGHDANDGLSRAKALKTVSRAASLIAPGDTVMIAGGNYAETVRIRAAGVQDRPILFRSMPGERVNFKGDNVSLVFQVIAKPDIRFDGLYFDAGFWDKVMVMRQSPRVQVTRCLNAMIGADECPGMLIRNCVVRGGWSGIGLSRSPGSIVENNVFIMTILRHIEGDSLLARNNIFCECIRNKAHQTLVSLGHGAVESNNCFYVRWPQDEKLAINWRPMTEYRVRAGSDALFANPMMPGTPGWTQGWQSSRVDDFPDCFAANPELIKRGIGLQPAAFSGFQFKTNWIYDIPWAEAFMAGTNAAGALAKAGQDAEALTAYTNLAAALPMSDRLKSDLLEQASWCAGRMKQYERAMELAKRIPVPPLAMRRQMQLMLDQKQYAALLAAFANDKMGGRSFHQGFTYPELEDLMADLLYYRSIAYRETGNLAAAEADLKVMNDKRMQLSYSSGESIHDLAWLRLGDFYRQSLKDDDRALAAYSNVLDRTMWAYYGRPRKPAARGADETLVAATKASSDILSKRGQTGQVAHVQFNLLQAQAEAAASVLKESDMIGRFREMLAMPGRFTPVMEAALKRIHAFEPGIQTNVVNAIGKMDSGLTEDTRTLLIKSAAASGTESRVIATRALLMFAPMDPVNALLDKIEKEGREKANRVALAPIGK
jgi:hypothetical protein